MSPAAGAEPDLPGRSLHVLSTPPCADRRPPARRAAARARRRGSGRTGRHLDRHHAEPRHRQHRRRQQRPHRRVAAHAANDVWTVGYDDDHSGSIPVRKTVWMHWDGARSSVVPSPNSGTGDNTLLGVIAPAGTSDAWAWGSSPDGTLVQRFTR
jgi:hypothetical protein